MLINENYKIESDTLNITVFQRGHGAGVGEYWRPIGFFATFHHASTWLIEQKIMGAGFKDYQAIVNQIEELKRMIITMIPGDLVKIQKSKVTAAR